MTENQSCNSNREIDEISEFGGSQRKVKISVNAVPSGKNSSLLDRNSPRKGDVLSIRSLKKPTRKNSQRVDGDKWIYNTTEPK